MKEVKPSKKRFSAWSYVIKADQQVLASFTSASLAYGHWLAYAEKYNRPDDPLCTCVRYRVCIDPYELQQQDITLNFMKAWESIKEKPTLKVSKS